MPDLVVDPAVLREVARRLDGLAGSLPGRAGSSPLDGVADALPGSRTADAAAGTAVSWARDGDDLGTIVGELATGISGAADGYQRTDTDLAGRTP